MSNYVGRSTRASAVKGRQRVKVERHLASTLPPPHMMTTEQIEAELRLLLKAEDDLKYDWRRHARLSQLAPEWDWRIWLIMSGRGWGKTKTGAETAREWGEKEPLHIAVVAENFTKCKDICFEHPTSGLLAVIPPELVKPNGYRSAVGATKLTLKNGTVYRALSAEKPDQARGYAFDRAWYDEFAAWPANTASETDSNVWFALRESADPKVLITTTPKALMHVRKLVKRAREGEGVHLTTGHMRENIAHLGPLALAELETQYDGTRLGRQELAGELLEDVEGALWQLWMFEVQGFRIPTMDDVPEMARVVVAMDPAASDREDSDATGIAVAGRGYGRPSTYADERPRGYLLHCEGFRGTPEARARKAVELYHVHQADAIVIEANNGGDWIPAVLRQIDASVPVRIVHASRGKHTRAEPVSALYQQYRVHHVGPASKYAQVEDQMTTWTEDSSDYSPDQMDALVWAFTDLLVNDPIVSPQAQRDRRLSGRR